MKLNLLLLTMDMLTILAYPILIVHGILRQFLKPREDLAVVKLPVPIPVRKGRSPFGR